jgi:hypothetical protein
MALNVLQSGLTVWHIPTLLKKVPFAQLRHKSPCQEAHNGLVEF